MTTMSNVGPGHPETHCPPPALDAQRDVVLAGDPAAVGSAGAQWERIADLLDDLVEDYESQMCADHSDEARAQAVDELQRVMNAFDLISAAARHNGEILDDIASEITLAQARTSAIWNDYERENAAAGDSHPGLIERRYATRAARDVWYPLDGALATAASRLRTVTAGTADNGDQLAVVVPIKRR